MHGLWLAATLGLAALAVTAATVWGQTPSERTRDAAAQRERRERDRAVDQAADAERRGDADTRGGQRPLESEPPPPAAPPDGNDHRNDDAQADRKPTLDDLVGVTAMRRRLGVKAPAGRGVVIGQVEGQAGQYLPVTRGRWQGSTAVVAQGGPSDAFGHAASVGRKIYGTGGVAPGIEIVHAYPVEAWMKNVLNLGTPKPPTDTPEKLVNHSWIGDHPRADRILRRVDHYADQRGVTIVAGVNNGASPVPHLLGSAYNVIAVGNADGNNSGGYTRVEVTGRCKPDLVAAGGLTSYTTAAVTGVVACLLEYVDRMPEAQRAAARRPEVLKAALLAGAARDLKWQPDEGKPLDETLGAGHVNVDRSLLMLIAGRAAPGKLPVRAGYALEDATVGDTDRYTITTSRPMGPVGVALTWHRRIDGRTAVNREARSARWLDTPRLTDFDLRLVNLDTGRPVEVSESAIDNVELIHVPELPPGRYAIDVERVGKGLDPQWRYGLAYLFEPMRD